MSASARSQKLLERMNKRQSTDHQSDVETEISNKATIIDSMEQGIKVDGADETSMNTSNSLEQLQTFVQTSNLTQTDDVASGETKTNAAPESEVSNTTSINGDQLAERLSKFVEPKAPKMEELYTRKTFWIRNDLIERVLKITGTAKGRQKEFLNEAIEIALELTESQMKSKKRK